MFDRIYTQHYINLPKEVRERITEVFGIVRTGITEIRDQTLISDATTNEDLVVITLEKLKEYTGSDGTFAELWHKTLEKIEQKIVLVEITEQIKNEPIEEEKKPKQGRDLLANR